MDKEQYLEITGFLLFIVEWLLVMDLIIGQNHPLLVLTLVTTALIIILMLYMKIKKPVKRKRKH